MTDSNKARQALTEVRERVELLLRQEAYHRADGPDGARFLAQAAALRDIIAGMTDPIPMPPSSGGAKCPHCGQDIKVSLT